MIRSVIITCALTVGIHTPTLSPYLLITPAEIAQAAVSASNDGASIVRLHARRPENGRPDHRPETFVQFLPVTKESRDAEINLSTGGRVPSKWDFDEEGYGRQKPS